MQFSSRGYAVKLLRPGRKRQCAKGKHSWHDVDAKFSDYAFNAPVEVCSKCGKWFGQMDKMYQRRVLEMMNKPPIFASWVGAIGATIGVYRT